MHDYQHHTHPRSRSIKIRVEPPDQVIVVTPQHVPKRKIDDFVKQSAVWIDRQLAKLKEKNNFTLTDKFVMIFGKKHDLDTLDISPFSQLESYLKATAEKYLRQRTRQLAEKMKISYGNLTVRRQKTRWGSCSSEGNLNFNWSLVHYPTEVIDYVIIHELAHRREMNHSAKFWEIVRHYDPAFQQHRGWLKRHGVAIG